MKKTMESFVCLYPITKTLRFELIPIGDTLKNIEKNGFIIRDKSRAESYKKMKKTLDEYHEHFIEVALKNVKLTKLKDYYELYCANAETKKTAKFKAEFNDIKKELRKEIVNCFKNETNKEIFDKLGKKELITKVLETWIKKEEKNCYFDPGFKKFTTYFRGYNINRSNMYSLDEKPSSIAYRLINENLPKFIDNIKVFEKIKETELFKDFEKSYNKLQKYLNINSMDELFSLENYNNTLTQSKITQYNYLIGGLITENGIKIQGFNELINQYNRKHSNKSSKLPKFIKLYKQILSPSIHISLLPDAFKTPHELLEATSIFFNKNLLNNENIDNSKCINVLKEIQNITSNIKEYELDKIYLRNDTNITKISFKIFKNYSFISDALSKYYDTKINPKYQEQYAKAVNKEKKQKEKEKFTKQEYISIKILQDAVDIYITTFDKSDENTSLHQGYSVTCISDYFKNNFYTEKPNENNKKFDFISNIMAKYSCVKGLLNTDFQQKDLTQIQKDNLKMFLDSILELLHFIKPLHLKKIDEYTVDDIFYSTFIPLFEQLNEFTKLYDKIRNFITKKPYSTEKFKLNFDNPVLAEGWDVNKEKDYASVLFKKDENYYIGILKDKKIFKDIERKNEFLADENEKFYSKIIYKQIPDPAKLISSKQINPQNPPKEIKDFLEKKKKDKKSLSKKEIINFIDYCQNDFLKNYSCLKDSNNNPYFNFKFKSPASYENLTEFFDDVKQQAYRILFIDIKESYINKLVSEDKLYLFQIYNKDFSPYSKGNPNLHTLYWKALFDDFNLKNVIYKLNGGAEIFYREKSIDYPPEIMKQGHHKELLKSKFNYPIIKDKRYTLDKFMLHVPITLNFNSGSSNSNINVKVLEFLKNNPDVNIIGIDRGERHLLYISVINQKGNVLLNENGEPIQYSLNKIISKYSKNNETIIKTVDYRHKLDIKEKERAKARENWGTIESIKELKEGYLSQVVHMIAELMVKYNAIVVMEDLNSGFKRGRFKVEKQVYQKFEKMLINKLNYLVLKNKNNTEWGGIYRALQLTNKFVSFKKLGKQCGFIFYVQAWNTSKIDPATGFVNLLNARHYTIKESQDFFRKFERISFNKEKGYFEFVLDYNNFTSKAEGTKTKWTICSYGDERYVFNKSLNNNRGGYEKWNVTEKIKQLLSEYGISYENGYDIKEKISEITETKFFVQLIKCLNVLLAMRYSNAEENKDFILSPVANEKGEFFNSENADKTMPTDADANGAYHIAKKGLLVLNKINKAEDLNRINLTITNKEWLNFVQCKDY